MLLPFPSLEEDTYTELDLNQNTVVIGDLSGP